MEYLKMLSEPVLTHYSQSPSHSVFGGNLVFYPNCHWYFKVRRILPTPLFVQCYNEKISLKEYPYHKSLLAIHCSIVYGVFL